MGEIKALINRISYTTEKVSAQDGFDGIFVVLPETLVTPLVFVILGIAIYADIGTEAGFWCQPRTGGTDIDNTVESRRTVQNG